MSYLISICDNSINTGAITSTQNVLHIFPYLILTDKLLLSRNNLLNSTNRMLCSLPRLLLLPWEFFREELLLGTLENESRLCNNNNSNNMLLSGTEYPTLKTFSLYPYKNLDIKLHANQFVSITGLNFPHL